MVRKANSVFGTVVAVASSGFDILLANALGTLALLDNVKLCSASVLDQLNGSQEPSLEAI